MTEQYSSALLAARHIASRDNANLASWSRQRWAEWLAARRNPRQIHANPPIIILVRVTCLDDVFLHVGLMQLFQLLGTGCTPLFSLPTEEAARIFRARARSEEWDGLVHVLADAKADAALAKLPAQARLIVFAQPAILSRSQLTRLGAGHSAWNVAHEPPVDATFIGSAGEYGQWRERTGTVAVSARAVIEVARWNPKTALAIPPAQSEVPVSETGAVALIEAGQINANVAQLVAGSSDEVLVLEATNEKRNILARRHTDLCSDGKATIRMPGRMLTTFPQRIRLETRGADGQSVGTEFAFHLPAHKLEPWMVTAFLNKGGGGNPMIRALAQGIGCRVAYADDEPFILRDIPIVWGVLRGSDRILARARAQGLYYFYIDHSYFDRGHGNSYRITRNRYEAGPVRDCPPDRAAALNAELQPWRRSGRDIIVCPPTDYFAAAHDCANWLDTTLARLSELTDRPVKVRTKPKAGEQAVPLARALESAHALVTHSSNVAIEAACLGTPIFVNEASAAAPVGCTDLDQIECPVYPDRDPWLAHLAYNQFTFEEIQDGRAWRMLLELEGRDFV